MSSSINDHRNFISSYFGNKMSSNHWNYTEKCFIDSFYRKKNKDKSQQIDLLPWFQSKQISSRSSRVAFE